MMKPTYLPLLVAICCALGIGKPSEAAGATPLVGAYYYPWWGPGGHDWTKDNTGATNPEELRLHLNPQQSPALGLYDSDSASVIAGHIDQSRKANIGFWAMSWAGKDSGTDKTIRNSVLANPRAGELKYAIHFETSSSKLLGSDPANPTFANLTPSFDYMAQNIFTNPNYLKIDGRPVVFMYLTRTYFTTQAGADAVDDHAVAERRRLLGDSAHQRAEIRVGQGRRLARLLLRHEHGQRGRGARGEDRRGPHGAIAEALGDASDARLRGDADARVAAEDERHRRDRDARRLRDVAQAHGLLPAMARPGCLVRVERGSAPGAVWCVE
jgi:hypothetical protein